MRKDSSIPSESVCLTHTLDVVLTTYVKGRFLIRQSPKTFFFLPCTHHFLDYMQRKLILIWYSPQPASFDATRATTPVKAISPLSLFLLS